MDIFNEKKKIEEKMKEFNFMLGRETHLIIYDFRHPIKKRTYNKTMYYFFNCRIISKDMKPIPHGKHTVQLASKRVLIPLFEKIKEKGKIDDKEIKVTIIKKDNYNFDITVHN